MTEETDVVVVGAGGGGAVLALALAKPNVAHHAIVAAVQQHTSVRLRYGTSFTGLIREGNQVVGVSTQGPDGTHTVRAKIVVGADGAFSKVREALKIPADLYLYPDGYLIAILESDEPVSESFYDVGTGLFWESFRRRGTRPISSI